jgi:hypothetical protein
LDEDILTPAEDATPEPLIIMVQGCAFEITPQDGCVSQCLIGGEVPLNLDELAEQARKLREAGLTTDQPPTETEGA